MNAIFENRFYRLLLLWLTLGVVFGYAWVATRMMEPRLEPPRDLIRGAYLIDGGKSISLTDAYGRRPIEITRVMGELSSLDSTLDLVGGLKSPVELIITADEPRRYLVTDFRVEMGLALVSSQGQLKKALLKAWVLQHARSDISSSLLRVEVVSDVLLGMLDGKFQLETPGYGEPLNLSENGDWLTRVSSFQAFCASPWQVLEVHALCTKERSATASNVIHPLSFRPVLGSVIWNVYKALPLLQRLEFVQAWTTSLASGPTTPDEPLPHTLAGWRVWARDELKRLLSGMPFLKKTESVSDSMIRTLIQSQGTGDLFEATLGAALVSVGLGAKNSTFVDFIFHSPSASEEAVHMLGDLIDVGNVKLWDSRVTALAHTPEGMFSLPGRSRLSDEDFEALRVRLLVWESCEAPTVRQILEYPVKAQRVLYVRVCENAFGVSYAPLIGGLGIQGFATANPSVPFAVLGRPSVEIARDRKWLQRESLLTDLLNRDATHEARFSGISDVLGLRNAKWRGDIRAFRVVGAVDAVEWYRGSIVPEAASAASR